MVLASVNKVLQFIYARKRMLPNADRHHLTDTMDKK